MRRVLAVVSDLHCGSTVGLCTPEPVELDDGGTYLISPAQRWLYDNWLDFWTRVGNAKRTAGWCGVLVNGDAVDGDHHGTVQIVSRDPGVQMWILKKVFEPALRLKPDWIGVVRGTEAHVGKNASVEESFARWLVKEGFRVPKDRETRMQTAWHLNAEIEGTLLSATHHGRIGNRPWTKANMVLNLAAQVFYEYAARGERHPDLAIRSHFHTFQDSYDAHPVRVIQTPAWQLATAYAHRVVPELLADIGGLILTFEKGKPPQVERVLYQPKRASTVRVS